MIDLGKDPQNMKMPKGMIMEIGHSDGPDYPCVWVDNIDLPGAKLGKEYTFKGTCSAINQSEDGNCYKFEIKSIDAPEASKEEKDEPESLDEAAAKSLKKINKKKEKNESDDEEAQY